MHSDSKHGLFWAFVANACPSIQAQAHMLAYYLREWQLELLNVGVLLDLNAYIA